MSTACGRLYYYNRKDPKLNAKKMSIIVQEKIDHFTKCMGYKPSYIILSKGEYIKGCDYHIEIRRSLPVQPSHFMLLPVIRKTPRIFNGKRKYK